MKIFSIMNTIGVPKYGQMSGGVQCKDIILIILLEKQSVAIHERTGKRKFAKREFMSTSIKHENIFK